LTTGSLSTCSLVTHKVRQQRNWLPTGVHDQCVVHYRGSAGSVQDEGSHRYRMQVDAVTDVERQVVRQWQESGGALARVRDHELRGLSDGEALAAADALLELLPLVPPREAVSGLVEQQRLFHARAV